MTNEKITDRNSECFLSRKFPLPEQQFRNKDLSQSSPILNMKNPLTTLNYLSLLQSIPLDQNHYDTTNSSNCSSILSEEPIVLKLNIPIEMIVRTMPQQISSSSQEQCNHRCSCHTHLPYQTTSENISKSPMSFIRKVQEIFFGNDNTNNDRGDIPSKSFVRADMPTFDSHLINDANRARRMQQQPKNFQKSCSKRCDCD
ncbi:hypothetical protein I4U23_021444 [Adineta vaga]|nr:hypothetical protein I4U23_021444 [Adineta vaga]